MVWLEAAHGVVILAGEFTEATTEYSIEKLHEALLMASCYRSAIREVNTEFTVLQQPSRQCFCAPAVPAGQLHGEHAVRK